MNKFIWIFLIIAILVGGGYYIYSDYEKPTDIVSYNISLSTKYLGELTKTGIEINGVPYNTSTSYETFNLIEGINTIKNINILDQKYYQNEVKFNISKNERIDIKLESPQLPSIKTNSINPIKVILSSSDFRGVDFCLDSSLSYLFVEPKETEFSYINLTNYTEPKVMRKYEYLEDYEIYKDYSFYEFKQVGEYREVQIEGFNNCYDGEFDLKGIEKTIEISYLEFTEPTRYDYIEITILDKEGNLIKKKIK